MEQPSFVSSCGSSYDVFLSFRGEDVRKNFVDHLYSALQQRGIYTFKDDEKLERGKSISPALEKAIEESPIAVVVFSEHYADSTWCLEEVVKIMECMEVKGQMVVPIFYGVNPSTVRIQKGKFGEAFEEHEKRFEKEGEKMKKWRKVLENVSNLSGWNLDNTENGHEAKLIQIIVEDIITKLASTRSIDDPKLVGMEPRMQKLYRLIGLESNEVRFVGIFGMSGVGKTTIAKTVYDKISRKFEGSCFIHEVRSESGKHGLVHLQQKLLSKILSVKDLKIDNVFQGKMMIQQRLQCKRVLIVLDDVDHRDQLESLVGNSEWFGAGSRIIITTKDKHLLIGHKVNTMKYYKMGVLEEAESFQLFRQHAFNKQLQLLPTKEFEDLEAQVVHYAGGLPLALEVLGSLLCGRDICEWRSEVARLKEIPEDEILEKLKVSFIGLNKNAQRVFLDIACFFNGKKRTSITRLLNSFNFHSDIAINILREKCLITISKGRILMHQLIQEMGWSIVRQEAPDDPKRYSRLWLPQDISQLLTGSEGTENIQGIAFNLQVEADVKVSSEAFIHMTKLRLLKFHNANASQAPNFLPDELRWLDWHGYPSTSLPATFQGQKLVSLKMQYSRVIQLWKGSKVLDNLKFMNLSHSQKLIRTPDFTGIPNLETLILEECTSLVEIHASVGFLKNLVSLNLKDCVNLKRLPESIHLQKLEIMILSGCLKLENFPKIAAPMACLLEVHAEATAIREVPPSIECLTNLRLIDVSNCKHLASLPSSICRLKGLKAVILSGCSLFENLPDELGEMECLEELYCDKTAIQELPSSISLLNNLVSLNLEQCVNLKRLPESIHFEKLETMILSGCLKLENFPEIAGPMACLLKVHAEATAIREVPPSIERLTNLRLIDVSNCKHLASLPSSICRLKGLKAVILSGCSLFEKLPDELGEMECLEELYCDKTAIQELPSSISLVKKLKILSFRGCNPLASPLQKSCSFFLSSLGFCQQEELFKISRLHSFLASLSGLSSLEKLDLSGCSMLDGGIPFDLGALSSLELLNLSNNKFVSIPAEAISCLPKLRELHMVGCNKLETLPQLPSSLKTVCLDECTALKGSIGSLTKYKNLNKISFTKCDQLLEDEHNSQIMIDAMWQHLIKGLYVAHDNFAICFPGKMIPEWFTYKNWGPSILVNLPQNWYNNKFVGFALCVVSEMINTSKLEHCGYLGVKYGIDVTLSLISPDGDKSNIGSRIGFMGNKQYADSNISCLAFSSFDKYWEFYYDWAHSPNEWCQFEVSQSLIESNSTVHRGFGVRLVYEDDVKQGDEELQEVMGQSNLSHSQFGKLGLFPAVFNGFHQRQRHLNIPDLI